MYNSLHLMFGELFVPSWFKLNSPVESRPQVSSGVPEPVEPTRREAGSAGSAGAAVGSDLDVASHVSPQLSQQHKGRGSQTASFTPGSASRAGTRDLF